MACVSFASKAFVRTREDSEELGKGRVEFLRWHVSSVVSSV